MADQIITLTSDFGTCSPFMGAMKGVILSINPAARVIDRFGGPDSLEVAISHQVFGTTR